MRHASTGVTHPRASRTGGRHASTGVSHSGAPHPRASRIRVRHAPRTRHVTVSGHGGALRGRPEGTAGCPGPGPAGRVGIALRQKGGTPLTVPYRGPYSPGRNGPHADGDRERAAQQQRGGRGRDGGDRGGGPRVDQQQAERGGDQQQEDDARPATARDTPRTAQGRAALPRGSGRHDPGASARDVTTTRFVTTIRPTSRHRGSPPSPAREEPFSAPDFESLTMLCPPSDNAPRPPPVPVRRPVPTAQGPDPAAPPTPPRWPTPPRRRAIGTPPRRRPAVRTPQPPTSRDTV